MVIIENENENRNRGISIANVRVAQTFVILYILYFIRRLYILFFFFFDYRDSISELFEKRSFYTPRPLWPKYIIASLDRNGLCDQFQLTHQLTYFLSYDFSRILRDKSKPIADDDTFVCATPVFVLCLLISTVSSAPPSYICIYIY